MLTWYQPYRTSYQKLKSQETVELVGRGRYLDSFSYWHWPSGLGSWEVSRLKCRLNVVGER